MKRIYLLMAAVLVTASIAITSCGKKNNDPIPSNPTPPAGGGGGGSTSPVACPSVMPGRTPGVLPNGVSNYMRPEGFWGGVTSSPVMEFPVDSCWSDSYIKLTFPNAGWFGASFLNAPDGWDNTATFKAGITKVKYHVKAPANTGVMLTAFPDNASISVKDSIGGTGAWVERTINVNPGWTVDTEMKFAEMLSIAAFPSAGGVTVEIANITFE